MFDPWEGKIPWKRKWQPTPVFLPGKFHGQRRLVGCSPWGCTQLATTEHEYTPILLEISIGKENKTHQSKNAEDKGIQQRLKWEGS